MPPWCDRSSSWGASWRPHHGPRRVADLNASTMSPRGDEEQRGRDIGDEGQRSEGRGPGDSRRARAWPEGAPKARGRSRRGSIRCPRPSWYHGGALRRRAADAPSSATARRRALRGAARPLAARGRRVPDPRVHPAEPLAVRAPSWRRDPVARALVDDGARDRRRVPPGRRRRRRARRRHRVVAACSPARSCPSSSSSTRCPRSRSRRSSCCGWATASCPTCSSAPSSASSRS